MGQGRVTGRREPADQAKTALDALHRGRLLARAGRLESAERQLRRAAALAPQMPEPHDLLGRVLLHRGRAREAADCFGRALQLESGNPAIMANLAEALARARDTPGAERWYRRALELAPNNLRALNNLATLLLAAQRPAEALDLLERLTVAHPDFQGGWVNQAEALLALGHPQLCIQLLDAASRHVQVTAPLLAQTFRAHAAAERFNEAARIMAHGLRVARRDFLRLLLPRSPVVEHEDYVAPPLDPRGAYVEYHFGQFRVGNWVGYEALRANMLRHIREALDEGVAIVSPNTPAYLASDDPALELRLARCYAKHFVRRIPAPGPRPPTTAGDRITIGFASPAFGHYAVDHVSRDLYRLLDRARFRVLGYSLRDRSDYWSGQIRACFDDFVDLSRLDNASAAERIRADQPDIVLDLYGYGPDQRPEIFARRPAPVQLCQVGLANTTGAPWIDYRIASRAALPDWLAEHFSEHVVHVPVTHHVLCGFPESAQTPSRREQGLPEDAFVFSCFQRADKITPAVVAAWGEVLKAVPDSVLWLVADSPSVARNLKRALEAVGVAGNRLVFARRVPVEVHVARQRLADAFLNTFAYSGFNTVAMALWCGVPVVALEGRTFATLGPAAALSAVGLEALLAADSAEYRERAVRLARDEAFRQFARAKLRPERLARNLFAGERTVRYLERAFETMVARQRAGEPPAPFAVPAD